MLWILNRCARMCIKIINSKFFYMGIGFQAGRRNIETSKNNCKKTIWLIQKKHDLLFLFIFVAFLIRSTMKKEEECGYFDSSNYFVVLDLFYVSLIFNFFDASKLFHCLSKWNMKIVTSFSIMFSNWVLQMDIAPWMKEVL